jgi:hypothetical protein
MEVRRGMPKPYGDAVCSVYQIRYNAGEGRVCVNAFLSNGYNL